MPDETLLDPIVVSFEISGTQKVDVWNLEMEVVRPDSDTDPALKGPTPEMRLDVKDLDGLNEKDYGILLAERLFAADQVRDLFVSARNAAVAAKRVLRLRLDLMDAPQLQPVHWEKLRDPTNHDVVLSMQERIAFSRWVSSNGWHTTTLLRRRDLSALIAVAGATELGENPSTGQKFAEIKVGEEVQRAKSSIRFIDQIVIKGQEEPLTLDTLIKAMADDPKIVYLACHGFVLRGKPYLLLQDEDGHAKPTSAEVLVRRMDALVKKPRLMILASCQSGGAERRTQDKGALSTLGPELIKIGIPAVVGMQGDVSLKTLSTFVPAMFESMQGDGHIDQAVAAARNKVELEDRVDWWKPVLYMGLKSGRAFYTPRFKVDRPDATWEDLRDSINAGYCMPIVGPGLSDHLLGTRREIARSWAKAHDFPIPAPLNEDLPQVAQFMAKRNKNPRLELRKFIAGKLIERYGDELGGVNPEDAASADQLNELASRVGRYVRDNNDFDAYTVLARMKQIKVYLTTQPTSLLSDALTATEPPRIPQVDYFRWRELGVQWPPRGQADSNRLQGSAERPIVYHLFGHLKFMNSVVLTEDDYFHFLRSMGGSQRDSISTHVTGNLATTTLLFVGFRLDDWDFRVLFNALTGIEGARRESMGGHVAVQLDPEEIATRDPDQVREYFEQYFGNDFTIYWGDSVEFLRDLDAKLPMLDGKLVST